MIRLFLIALLATVILSCQNEQQTSEDSPVTIGDFTFSSENIQTNKAFTITYHGTKELGNSFYHGICHDKSYPYDLEFKDNQTSIKVPDSISLISFYFKTDDEIDNNLDKGYLFFNVNDNNEKANDHLAAEEYYLLNMGYYYDLTGGNNKKAYGAIDSVMLANKDLEEYWKLPVT